jgi:uncharacterized membrane protein
MSWATRFRIRQYLQESLWVVPLLAVVLGVVLGAGDVQLDKSIHLPSNLTYSPSTATTVLSTIVGAMAALTGFVVTVTVLVAQMVIGTFSARFMRVWYRDAWLKALLGVLIGTLAFSFLLLRRVESNFVPNLGVSIAGLLVLLSLVLFTVFLGSYLHQLRPVAVAALGTYYVHQEFKRLAAEVADAPDVFAGPFEPDGQEATLVVRSSVAGAIQAIHVKGLVEWARQQHCLLVVQRQVGDFVPAEAALIRAYGARESAASDERVLRGMFALGTERTVDQDPAFALRIIVDVAAKALSAAINDPTTAVQVLDQLGEVLRVIGTTDVKHSRWPANGGPSEGLVIPIRSWEEYLALGVTEIREYGSTSIQVVRRLRAMLEELRRQVSPDHRPAVDEQLARLDATVTEAFGQSVDLDLARIADEQGIGGRVTYTSHHAMTH